MLGRSLILSHLEGVTALLLGDTVKVDGANTRSLLVLLVLSDLPRHILFHLLIFGLFSIWHKSTLFGDFGCLLLLGLLLLGVIEHITLSPQELYGVDVHLLELIVLDPQLLSNFLLPLVGQVLGGLVYLWLVCDLFLLYLNFFRLLFLQLFALVLQAVQIKHMEVRLQFLNLAVADAELVLGIFEADGAGV